MNPHSSNTPNVCLHYYFITNQQLFINFAAQQQTLLQASTTSSRHHGKKNNILAFTIPTILTLVQLRYTEEDLFKTHPIIMMVVLSSVLSYCLAFSLLGLLRLFLKLAIISSDEFDSYEYIYKWCQIIMMLFGSLSVASLFWLLLFSRSSSCPPLFYLTLCFLFLLPLLLLGLASKLLLAVTKFLSPAFLQGQNRVKRTSPLLPVSSAQ
ncbi:PREDICTED: PRUPE_2G142700 [Prunus dulcis]|uniref:PREDICTED: PRUPE_2G142700 n=1 Tax=Prunus dulcis TaxID=3755 RepID=A0A5E4GK39_PRUDU|nr:hypothetical protein L3X38_013116 [Prunus dulcis]VVA40255.1 PREDICTED: PRUPE_2G142700 [Prunus dulcis]